MIAFLKHPIVLLSIGGALGANARFWLGYWLKSHGYSEHFPWSTFIANVSGAFLLSLLTMIFVEKLSPEHQWGYILLGTGFCGAYTTFSTFAVETWALLQRNPSRWDLALLNVLGSVLAGFVAVVIAVRVMHKP